jgi:hypothetical protein
MNRKQIVILLCVIVAGALLAVLTWNTGRTAKFNVGRTTSQSPAQVITQGGTITLVPGDSRATMFVISDLSATNTQSKTSSPPANSKVK